MWRKIQKFLATFVPILLMLAYLAVAVCLLNRWDAMVVVTLVPVWLWAAVGALVSLLCWIACRRIAPGFVFCLCLATGVVFSEETRGLYREVATSLQNRRGAEPEEAVPLRIVAVRCGGGEVALRRAAESSPDILVVQEAPGKMVLEAVADQLYGVERSVTSGGTLAVLARGEALAVLPDPQGAALHVRLKRPDGFVCDVTVLDLPGCAPRRDMWRPAVWGELVQARVETRRLVRTHLGENPINRAKVARIVCGGFGTPPGDDVFRPLENGGMVDTFSVAGVGWGNTFPSDYPLLRLDQIWVSPNLAPVKTSTRLNPDSDHRIVVSDVRLPGT